MRMIRGGTRLLMGWVGGTEKVRYRERTSVYVPRIQKTRKLRIYSTASYTQITSSDKRCDFGMKEVHAQVSRAQN